MSFKEISKGFNQNFITKQLWIQLEDNSSKAIDLQFKNIKLWYDSQTNEPKNRLYTLPGQLTKSGEPENILTSDYYLMGDKQQFTIGFEPIYVSDHLVRILGGRQEFYKIILEGWEERVKNNLKDTSRIDFIVPDDMVGL